MRLLMLSHGYPPTVSGVTLVVQKIARAMAGRGHDVTVVTASDRLDPYEDEDEGVRLVRVRAWSNPVWSEAPIPLIGRWEAEAVLDEVRPDLIHTHESALLALQFLWAMGDADLPRVATCYYVPRFLTRYVGWNGQVQRAIESVVSTYSRWFFNHFDHVIFATEAHRAFFFEQGLQVPTLLVSHGVDLARYHPPNGQDDVDKLARYRLPDGPRVLFVGRLARDKEIDVLLHGVAEMERPAAHLILVGRGDDRARLEQMTAELGLQQRVHFLGFVPEEDLPALYRACDLFAITSRVEVQSLPVLQAVATGMPVVAAQAMALPELVHDGDNGLLVPPGDPSATAEAIANILSNPALADRMGQVSLAIAEPHGEAQTLERYDAFYRRIADSG